MIGRAVSDLFFKKSWKYQRSSRPTSAGVSAAQLAQQGVRQKRFIFAGMVAKV
jgi:hypothetical protein